jgi:hypothetical protein
MAFFTGSTNANAQGQGGTSPAISVIPVSLTYSYSYNNSGCDPSGICGSTTITTTFSGSANITPVEGGYGGTGSGVCEDVEDSVVQPYQNCPQGHSSHMAIAGNTGMIVNYQFSIDNDVTGGPDTTMNITGTNTPMYNSS